MITTFRNHLIITIFAVTTVSPYPADGKSVKDIFVEVSSGIVVVFARDAGGKKTVQGSGVVIGKNEVVTNCHIVSDAQTIAVRQAADPRGRQTYGMDAQLLERNEQRDLCLLFVDELSVPPAANPVPLAAARSVSIGEDVYAIGAPRGLELSISRGIISQLRGDYGKRSAPIIQTDAAISPGSSGGGLFNENGELIGITTFKVSSDASEGLSFALPVEWVKELRAHAAMKIAAGRERKKCFSSPTTGCLLTVAMKVAEAIDATSDRARMLSSIAAKQATAGDKTGARDTIAQALQTAQAIKYADGRAEALHEIAMAQVAADDKTGAKETIAQALQTARENQNTFDRRMMSNLDRARVVVEIITTQAETGDIAGALQTTGVIEHAYTRARALRKIAEAQAVADDKTGTRNTLAQALQSAQAIKFSSYRATALRKIATVQAAAGDKTGARSTITQALQAAQAIKYADGRARTLSSIATAQASAGDETGARNTIAQAFQTARTMEYSGNRASVLREIALAQAETGNVALALQAAGAIENAFKRAWALREIALAQAETADLAEAFQISRAIEEASNRARALRKIAAAQTSAGDKTGARNTLAQTVQTARAIENASIRARKLRKIAAAQATAGDKSSARNTMAQALQAARKIQYAFGRAQTLRNSAATQAETGDIAGALQTAQAVENAYERAWALSEIAVALSKTK